MPRKGKRSGSLPKKKAEGTRHDEERENDHKGDYRPPPSSSSSGNTQHEEEEHVGGGENGGEEEQMTGVDAARQIVKLLSIAMAVFILLCWIIGLR
tara:strand:+ start:1296 stop:1583 length:288 start_codon:yes stop_codon:yes gene_type:complete